MHAIGLLNKKDNTNKQNKEFYSANTAMPIAASLQSGQNTSTCSSIFHGKLFHVSREKDAHEMPMPASCGKHCMDFATNFAGFPLEL